MKNLSQSFHEVHSRALPELQRITATLDAITQAPRAPEFETQLQNVIRDAKLTVSSFERELELLRSQQERYNKHQIQA